MHVHVKRIEERGDREEKRKENTSLYMDIYKDEEKKKEEIAEVYDLVYTHG
jgi:hypothetical protein